MMNKEFNLGNFKSYLVKKRLSYSDVDLINFHACVDSSYLTILAGYSGTGKSALAKAYVKFITNNDKNRYVIIPVSPLFTQPEILCGYYSHINKSYQPDKNGFIDLIRRANEEKNEDKAFYVIFDELNLAPVENWFCEFISKMESGEDLILYNEKENLNGVLDEFIKNEGENISPKIVNKLEAISKQLFQEYKSRYSINNIKFIGTMNEDESGNMVSGRVLDRANKVILQRANIDSVIESLSRDIKLTENHIRFIEIVRKLNKATLDTIEELKNMNADYLDVEKNFISPRIISSSIKFIDSVEKMDNGAEFEEDVVDYILSQRIITKLSGNDSEFLIKKWIQICEDNLCKCSKSLYELNKILQMVD